MRPDQPVEVVMVGAGQRGHDVFGRWALEHPDLIRFVAVVDPDAERQARFGSAHEIPRERRYEDVDELVAAQLDVGAAIVASWDRGHAIQSVKLLHAGYYVLAEKPIASSLEELRWLLREVGDSLDRLQVVFELRLAAFYEAIHEVVTSGRLGDIVMVTHTENLAPWFMAHSFVRGNWARAALATPAIVAKCSHDFDLLAWNAQAPVKRISSFGSLQHFRPDQAPAAATARCTDGCPIEDCLFDARRIYGQPDSDPWLIPAITNDRSAAGIERALQTGPYGKCVYQAGSDVVDHQVVAMELTDGSTITLQLNGHSYQPYASARNTRYDGTLATLRGILGPEPSIEIHDHYGGRETIEVPRFADGHGGADDLILQQFADHARRGEPMPTSARDGIEGHLLAFAAEEARLSGETVDMERLRADIWAQEGADRGA